MLTNYKTRYIAKYVAVCKPQSKRRCLQTRTLTVSGGLGVTF